MARRGCLNGCVHNKEIKLPEMKENYIFRCEAMGCYMTTDNIKQSCRFFELPYKVKINSIEDFMDGLE